MSDNSVNFTENELGLIKDQEFLLSKIEIGGKIERLLGRVEKELHTAMPEYLFPEKVLVRSGKISKGENYRGLPYYILDFPRRFGKEGVFAFRTMFWWGNLFSATLQLSGIYLDERRNTLISNIESIKSSQPFISVGDDPWQHHFAADNYLPAHEIEAAKLQNNFNSKAFIKIAYRWPLQEYIKLPELVRKSFIQTMGWVIQ